MIMNDDIDDDDDDDTTKTTMMMSMTILTVVLWIASGAGLPVGHVSPGHPVQLVPAGLQQSAQVEN